MTPGSGSGARGGEVRLTGVLRCTNPQQVAAIRRHLHAHLRLSRAEPGCLSFELWQTADPLLWRVEERFASRDAFEAHHINGASNRPHHACQPHHAAGADARIPVDTWRRWHQRRTRASAWWAATRLIARDFTVEGLDDGP